MTPKPLEITTPTDTTLVLTRTFNAPNHRVWQAMFVADNMRRWMLPPPGWTTTTCECDPRVGGALRVAWKSAEADPAMTLQGTFTEVIPNQRAVHTETMEIPAVGPIGSLVETHEFTDQNGTTLMRITQKYDSKEARDGAMASGMDQGMEACYQHLDALLKAEPAA